MQMRSRARQLLVAAVALLAVGEAWSKDDAPDLIPDVIATSADDGASPGPDDAPTAEAERPVRSAELGFSP